MPKPPFSSVTLPVTQGTLSVTVFFSFTKDNKASISSFCETLTPYVPPLTVWLTPSPPVKVLVSHGANLNFISRDGQSVLVLAVGTGNAKVVELLAKYGADPDVKDQMGMSARQYAKLFKKPAMVEAFEKYSKPDPANLPKEDAE